MNNRPMAFVVFLSVLSTSVISGPSWAEPAGSVSLKEAAQTAVLKNPEVQLRWHNFREATEEIGVAQGGFLPKVDISASPGSDRLDQDGSQGTVKYRDTQTNVTFRQMLFDGFATSNEVKRLGRAKLVRYFELLDSMENMALEAGRAYLDVVRNRQHLALAEENFQLHKTTHEQLLNRARSGVGKRVDVDQAESRLALADVNVTTTRANLHDATARYLRVVGEQPLKDMKIPDQSGTSLPSGFDAVFAAALKTHPALRASIENTEAAQFDLDVRRAAYMPKLDFVVRNDGNSNYLDGGSRKDTRVELRVNFNLFNGGSDMARMRQYRERKNVALDNREKICRDMRQIVSVAYNDVQRLNDQVGRIRTQVGLVEKTRAAYRDQFNIGQRTLLDLLNTQNEYFDARRSLVNTDIDLSLAYLRSYAGMGRLLDHLGLKRGEDVGEENDLSVVELTQLCPRVDPGESASSQVGANLYGDMPAIRLLDTKP